MPQPHDLSSTAIDALTMHDDQPDSSGPDQFAEPGPAGETASPETVQEAGQPSEPASGTCAMAEADSTLDVALNALITLAQEADDPVAALEDGIDSLADALVAENHATQAHAQAERERHVEQESAYRYARLHRIGELTELGYGLDQAVAIADSDEAEVWGRAAAAGRDPLELIYSYAVLNGYQAEPPAAPRPAGRGTAADNEGRRHMDGAPSSLAALARLSDEAFAEATAGERWERLMRR